MKVRHRIAIVTAGSTSATLALAFAFTATAFRSAQERQLDQSLLARARVEAEEVAQLGGRTLEVEQESTGSGGDVEQLVKYGAIYRADGQIVAGTPTFAAQPPALWEVGWKPGDRLPRTGFEFPYRGQMLRGVLVRVRAAGETGATVLLLAASRQDLDADSRRLLELMIAVLGAATALSLVVGWWLGGHLARGVESLAAVAREVAEGRLAARVDVARVGGGTEVRALAGDVNAMVERLGALIDAERRFVSYAAHELRSPLATLRGELELALRRPRGEDAYRNAIGEALESTDRLESLAESLLALARLGVTPARGDDGEVRLAEVVREAVAASQARAAGAPPVAIEAGDATVKGRFPDLVRLVRNLVDNAVAHAPAGTTVRVAVRREPGRAVVSVEDAGPGVAEAVRDRMFEPFVRGEDERGRAGAGLGLAIAREVARAHGGDVAYERDGGVTRFVATIADR